VRVDWPDDAGPLDAAVADAGRRLVAGARARGLT
jgi:hypothetical protein